MGDVGRDQGDKASAGQSASSIGAVLVQVQYLWPVALSIESVKERGEMMIYIRGNSKSVANDSFAVTLSVIDEEQEL